MLDNQSPNTDQLEEFFRKRFQEHEEMPSDDVWNAVAAGLEKMPQKGAVLPFWKRTSFYLGLGSVVLLVVAYFYFTQEKETKNIPIQRDAKGGKNILPEPAKIPIEVKMEIKAKVSKIQSEPENIVTEKKVPLEEVMQSIGISEEKKVVQEEKEIEHKPEPVEETTAPEPEPENLFEKLKKEQKAKAKKELFIEKKE